MNVRAAAVIPARWASSRFPGKPLAALTGTPMIVHVLERAERCRTVSRIVVAPTTIASTAPCRPRASRAG